MGHLMYGFGLPGVMLLTMGTLAVVAVAVAASVIPALRAARLDPVKALQSE
jgi:ABC-type lipoprotein release transport system permease subunit